MVQTRSIILSDIAYLKQESIIVLQGNAAFIAYLTNTTIVLFIIYELQDHDYSNTQLLIYQSMLWLFIYLTIYRST